MSALRKGNRKAIRLGLATFTCSILFVWQGLDFTDMGSWLTGYQQFSTHPDTINGACWLSFFIGHWFGLLLGGSVIAYKLGYVVVVTFSAIIAYQLLASQLGRSRTLAATVLLTVWFTRAFGGNWVDYNNLTGLFYLAGAALLFFGLINDRRLLVLLAGVVLGANIFVRFPNLLGVSLVAAIWLQAWSHRWTLRGALAGSAWFLGGFALGAVAIWSLIVLHGHEHQLIYLQSIRAVFGLAADASSHHAGSGMLKRFISDHVQAFNMALPLVVFGGWIANWVSKQKKLLVTTVISAGSLLLVFVLYRRDCWRWIVPGICYVVLLAVIFRELRKDRNMALLAFIAGVVLLVTPLGSNNGIVNAVFGMWLALPLTLVLLWRTSDITIGQFSMEARGVRVFAITYILALCFQSLATAWRHTYLDSENRLAMTHSIAHTLLTGTYTTAERAKVISELLEAMSHFAKPGDEVLAYNAIPTVHFLTQTHPWLGNPWPDFEGADKLAALIRQKEEAGARMPCVVRATGSTYADSWPVDAQPLATWWHQDERRHVLVEFEQRHGYVVAWTNDFFEILTTDQRLEKRSDK